MKNIIKILLLVSILFIYSCEKENNYIEQSNAYNLNKSLVLKNTTTNISSFLMNAGVTKLEFNKDNNKLNISVITSKSFILFGEEINLSDYNAVIENNVLSLEKFNDYKVSLLDNSPYLITPTYNGLLENFEDGLLNDKLTVLLLYLNELTNNNLQKLDSENITNQKGNGCSFGNTYYVYGVGGNEAGSAANLIYEIDYYADSGYLNNCSALGGSSTGCAWENHFCISTQAFCCNNAIIDK